MLNPKDEKFDTGLVLLANKKASCALAELTHSTGHLLAFHNPGIAGSCSNTGRDHFDSLTHLNIAHPG
jgi:hypothetical protein